MLLDKESPGRFWFATISAVEVKKQRVLVDLLWYNYNGFTLVPTMDWKPETGVDALEHVKATLVRVPNTMQQYGELLDYLRANVH